MELAFAFAAMLRSHGLQKLTAVVAAHSPLLEALRSKNPAPIFGDSGDAAIAQAFGFLESFTGR